MKHQRLVLACILSSFVMITSIGLPVFGQENRSWKNLAPSSSVSDIPIQYKLPDGTILTHIISQKQLPANIRPYWKGHHALYFFENKKLGYRACLCMHRTREVNGVLRSTGGTAIEKHERMEDILIEALLLSYQMSLKPAMIFPLKIYGGKFVIDFDNASPDRDKVLASAATALEWMSKNLHEGTFSGQDVNISPQDVAWMRQHAPSTYPQTESPAKPTADGVMGGLLAASEVVFRTPYTPDRSSLAGKVVSLAGLGNVGRLVLNELLDEGATVIASETNLELRMAIQTRYQDAIKAGRLTILDIPDQIYDQRADIFCPCTSERRILDEERIERLYRAGVKLVAGSSNMQIGSKRIAILMFRKGIVYVPDALINAGGLMGVEGMGNEAKFKIFANVLDVITLAKRENRSPYRVFLELSWFAMRLRYLEGGDINDRASALSQLLKREEISLKNQKPTKITSVARIRLLRNALLDALRKGPFLSKEESNSDQRLLMYLRMSAMSGSNASPVHRVMGGLAEILYDMLRPEFRWANPRQEGVVLGDQLLPWIRNSKLTIQTIPTLVQNKSDRRVAEAILLLLMHTYDLMDLKEEYRRISDALALRVVSLDAVRRREAATSENLAIFLLELEVLQDEFEALAQNGILTVEEIQDFQAGRDAVRAWIDKSPPDQLTVLATSDEQGNNAVISLLSAVGKISQGIGKKSSQPGPRSNVRQLGVTTNPVAESP